MQIILSGVLLILMIIIFFLLNRIDNAYKDESIRRLKLVLYSVEGMIISEIAILLVRDRTQAFLAFTAYYIMLLWLIYALFRFSIAYAGYGKRQYYKVPFFWITVTETLLLIWGFFSKRFFTITHIRWAKNYLWASREFSFFYVYTGICIVILCGIVSVMLIPTMRSAKIYMLKYVSIIFLVIAITAIYSFTMYYEMPLFIPVLFVSTGSIVLIYVAVYYAPSKLMQKAMLFTADVLNDGMLLYNDAHHLQFVTDRFCNAFNIKNTDVLGDEKKYWNEIYEAAENVWVRPVNAIMHDDKKYYYEVHHETFEENGKTVGTVYWIKDVTESIDNYEKMMFRANFDELTGIYNEAHFYEVSKNLLNSNDDKYVMICTRIEKYKLITEILGKEKVHEYVKLIADMIKNGMSKISNCQYGRVDEDGFYLLLPRASFIEQDLLDVLDRITEELSISNFKFLVKMGVYEIQDRTMNISSICNRASVACDSGKDDYHRRLIWFNENVQAKSMLMERYNAELSDAIANGDIQMFMQPQFDREGKMTGAEALARWIHKEHGLISPDSYIPFFEKNGRVTEIDKCIWRQACKKLREWKNLGKNDLYISVNISAKDLYALDIYEHFKGLVEEYEIEPQKLKLEITESAIISDTDDNIDLIDRLHKLGFEVEMDDFGSAYSSFNMLKDLYVDVLKIDMKFLSGNDNKSRSRTILKSIINMSKDLKMNTVVEGVETEEQYELLKNLGCDVFQGFYFSKPISEADFEAKYF